MRNDLRKRLSDDLLEAALEEQLETDTETQSYPSGSDTDHVFSDEHNKKMKRIFRLAEKAERRPQQLRKYRQMAAGILIFFAASVVTVSNVEAFRLPLLNFFAEVQQDFTLFHVQKGPAATLTRNHQEHEPHYTPEGFIVTEVSEISQGFYILYKNDKTRQYYAFHFMNASDSAFDTENAQVTNTQINGNQAVVIEKSQKMLVVMYKDDVQYQVDGNISTEEAVKILESIK